MSHDPIFQNMGLIFYMPFLYHFALTIKQYTPSLHNTVNCPCLIFSLGYLNEWICPWFSPRRFNIVFLFLIWTPSCFSSFIYFASTFSVKTFCLCWLNVDLHRLPIFRISFTQRLTLRRIPRTSYMHHIHPSYNSSSINNGKKNPGMFNNLWHANKSRTFK